MYLFMLLYPLYYYSLYVIYSVFVFKQVQTLPQEFITMNDIYILPTSLTPYNMGYPRPAFDPNKMFFSGIFHTSFW